MKVKNWNRIAVLMACVLVIAGVVVAEDKTAGGCASGACTTQPTTQEASTTQPAEVQLPEITMPAKLPAVAATVGSQEISGTKINEIIEKNFAMMNEGIARELPKQPAERQIGILMNLQQRMNSLPQTILNQMIFQDLLKNFVKSQNIQVTDADVAKIKEEIAVEATKRNTTVEAMMEAAGITDEDLMDQARTKKLTEEIASPEKVAAFIKDNPSCFNGTMVQASHILIACGPLDATTEQKAAVEKLEKIAADINAGTITFEDAAKEFSTDPGSKEKGGDLGEFTFQRMVPSFAMAAFHTEVGKLSKIVRSQFGFHLIKVTKRTEGTETVNPELPENQEVAKNVLMSEMQNQIFNQALTDCPIVINK